MNRWKAILAATLIFATGVASGFFVARASHSAAIRPREGGGPPSSNEGRPDFIGRLKRDLALTDEQAKHVDAILQDGRVRNRLIWETVQPQMREENKRVRELIETELSPEQRTKYGEIMKQHSRDRERRGPGPEGGWRRNNRGPGDTNAPESVPAPTAPTAAPTPAKTGG